VPPEILVCLPVCLVQFIGFCLLHVLSLRVFSTCASGDSGVPAIVLSLVYLVQINACPVAAGRFRQRLW